MTFYYLWKNESLHGEGDTEPAPGQCGVREEPAEEASQRKQAPAPHGKGATSSQEEGILPRTEHLAREDRDRRGMTAARGTVCVLGRREPRHADGVATPEKCPRGQTRSLHGYAHSWQKRRILGQDPCLQARQSTGGHSALRRAPFPRPRDGESHSRRTYRAIPRNGTAPRTEMPRREELAFQDVGGTGFHQKDETLRMAQTGSVDLAASLLNPMVGYHAHSTD